MAWLISVSCCNEDAGHFGRTIESIFGKKYFFAFLFIKICTFQKKVVILRAEFEK